ncbi:MAG: hypothetical protein KKA54_21220 [Proteobacteria bacterium]|nr:hypothetical protein [Pseudomonadota bacterium]
MAKMAMGLLFCFLTFSPVLFPASVSAFDIEIDVSPNVLNIESPVEELTVHTNIAFAEVNCSTVELDVAGSITVPRLYCKSDNRGYFVGKFAAAPLKDSADKLAIDEYNTFIMTGTAIMTDTTTEVEEFSGKQEIKVIKVIPEGL